MDISTQNQEDRTTISLSGRLDTVTSTQLAQELDQVFGGSPVNLEFDLKQLEYVSSAGLRVILTAQKKVNTLGIQMKLTGVNESVREVFDITGFSSILTID